MRATDVTDDGERIEMLGSSGAIACYDVEQRKKFDDSTHNCTPIGVGETTSLTAIDVYNEFGRKRQMVAIGSNGNIYQRTGKQCWNHLPANREAVLEPDPGAHEERAHAIRLGDEYDVGVGKAGTVIERPRGKPQNAGSSHDDDNFDGRGETYDGDDEGIQQRDKAAREEGGSESRDEQSQ